MKPGLAGGAEVSRTATTGWPTRPQPAGDPESPTLPAGEANRSAWHA